MALARRQNIYVACEDFNFVWDEQEVLRFDELWKSGVCIHDIAKQLHRDPDEVVLLVLDRVRNNFIRKRKGGAWGNDNLRTKIHTNTKGN